MFIERENALNVDFNNTEPHMIKTEIENIPIIDAVPVVRCKDCQHWGNGCEIFMQYNEEPYETDGDDFCSYGKRKEQG